MRAVLKLGGSRRGRRIAFGLAAVALTLTGLVSGAHPALAAAGDGPSSDVVPVYPMYIVSYLPDDVTYVTISGDDAAGNWSTGSWPTFPCGEGQECAVTDTSNPDNTVYGYWPYNPHDEPTVQAWEVYGTPASFPVTAMTGDAGYFSSDNYYVCFLNYYAQDTC